jgi:hypothetical protein
VTLKHDRLHEKHKRLTSRAGERESEGKEGVAVEGEGIVSPALSVHTRL